MADQFNRRREDNSSWYRHKLIALLIALILGGYGFTALTYQWVKGAQDAIATIAREDLRDLSLKMDRLAQKIDCLSDKRFCR